MTDGDIPAVQAPQPELSGKDRQRIGLARGRKKIIDAIALYEKVESADPESVAKQVRAMAMNAMPAIMRNLVSMATGTGKHARAPAVAQAGAAKLVAGAAGIALETPASAGQAKTLGEMHLGELESNLMGILDNVQRLRAIESQAQHVDSIEAPVPDLGASAKDEPPAQPPS